MRRLFFGLMPDRATREALVQAAEALDVREARRIQAAGLHLTLLFLGRVEDLVVPRLLAAASHAAAPHRFTLEIGLCGWWRRSGVAWLAPFESPPALSVLRQLVEACAQDVVIPSAAEAFSPHVTIARNVRRAPRATGAISVRWPVADFALLESFTEPAGARYEVLARWPLK